MTFLKKVSSLPDTARHILVTGSHRSGTTWVGRTISHNKRILYVDEPFNVDYPNCIMDLKLSKWFTYYPSSRQKERIQNSFDKLFLTSSFYRTIWIAKNSGIDIKTPYHFCEHLLKNSFRASQILIKDPIALLSAGWLYEKYNLKVICMIRNPLAFVGSLKKLRWDFDFKNLKEQRELMENCLPSFATQVNMLCGYNGDFIDRACLLWNVLHYIILQYQKRYQSWLFVRYEDIAVNPIIKFQEIYEYLGFRLDNLTRRYIQKYTSDGNPIEARSDDYQPRDAKRSLNTWKERLSNHEIDRVKRTTDEIATKFYGDFG